MEFDNLNMYIVMTEKLLHRKSKLECTIGIKMLMSGIGNDIFERYPRTRDMT